MSALRLLKWLTLFALFLAPFAMIGAPPAMAHGPAVAAGHCDDRENPDEAPPIGPVDCTMACAGLPAAPASAIAGRAPLPAAPARLVAAAHLAGLQPEAATPPPRIF